VYYEAFIIIVYIDPVGGEKLVEFLIFLTNLTPASNAQSNRDIGLKSRLSRPRLSIFSHCTPEGGCATFFAVVRDFGSSIEI